MNYGLDTSFLVAAEIVEHPEHSAARKTISRLLANGDGIAIAPRVLAEFIHVASDSRRFAQPLDVNTARQLALQWWTARSIVRVYPDDRAVVRFLDWLQVHASVESGCWTRFWPRRMKAPVSHHS
jgi:predicted nucleic acid-binding protein